MLRQVGIIGVALAAQLSWGRDIMLCGVEWAPFTYTDKQKIVSGGTFAMLTEAFRRLGLRFQANELPWPRCLEYVKSGRYDAVIDNAPSPHFISGQHPTGNYPLGVYVLDTFPQTTFSWSAMQGKTIGMVRGYDYTAKITSFKGWHPNYATTDEDMLRKLARHRYDYVVLDPYTAPILAERLQIKIRVLTPLLDSTKLYLTFNKNKRELAAAYDRVVGEMIKDGTLEKIYKEQMPYGYQAIMQMSVSP
ncbi:transporter substrate-binding domain-containing protein [Chitinivorax sp. B]|uniref:substrate-binding periplasmic protein n=1 Tax=Chitinivorax sp. B TaxID=2502235 RepID=UPI0010F73340|nr:transporter substrate-binding domain-containing protein [Chitinivorax sp. B]